MMIAAARYFPSLRLAVLLSTVLVGLGPIQAATLPVFKLDGALSESPSELAALLGDGRPKTLYELVSRMEQAADDPDVPAVVILIESPRMGFGQTQEIRGAMGRLRQAGKKVHLFAERLGMGTYLLSTGASDITVVPSGVLMVTGLNPEAMYLRGLLDKIGVEPDLVHIGDYKSAGETFVRKGPSPAALEQMDRLLDDIYSQMIRAVGQAREMEPEQAETALTSGPYSAERALEIGLIDSVRYRKDFLDRLTLRYEAELETRYGGRKKPELDFSAPFAIFQFFSDLMQEVQPSLPEASIAVVNVEGLMMDGKSDDGGPLGKVSGSRTLRQALEKAAADDTIKAVVLRVDSPGGSSLASEIMWKGTQRLRRAKPLIVSMGNVAASGGYYVSCGADYIFADEGTITGSIGVLGGKMVTAGLWDKLGVNWHQSPRGQHATLFSSSAPFSERDREVIRSFMNETYVTFKKRVADGRGNRIKGDLEPLAGGRVYTGREAREIGLVDEIGGLQEAMAFAAKRAGLDKYKVRVLPEPKTILDLLREALGLDDDSDLKLQSLRNAAVHPLLKAALPLLENLDPERRAAVVRSLRMAEMLTREAVLLVPPFELVIY